MLAAPPVPRAEPLRSLEHLAHASTQGGSPTSQPDRHTSKTGAHASLAIGDRALGLAPSAYLQLGGRALLRLPVHVHAEGTLYADEPRKRGAAYMCTMLTPKEAAMTAHINPFAAKQLTGAPPSQNTVAQTDSQDKPPREVEGWAWHAAITSSRGR